MHPAFDYPSPLGGSHGGHRQANQAASSGAADASYLAYMGAVAQAAAAFHAGQDAIEDAGIRAGEIIGYRAWTWDGRLHSMHADFTWTPGAIERADEIDTYKGLHAFKTLQAARRTYDCFDCAYFVVFGTVALWGEVIEHEKGYRAEYAAVHSLISMHKYTRDLADFPRWQFWKRSPIEPIRRLYGVDNGQSTNKGE